MKNRKKVVVALLLVCVLCLGIGYAALTDTLYVNGTVDVAKNADLEDEFNADVYFSEYLSLPSGVTASIGADDDGDANDKLTISVDDTVLKKSGDSVKISANIINESTVYDAIVTLHNATSTTDTGLFTVTCAWASGSDGTIVKGGTNTNTVEITITLNKTLTEDTTDTFAITFDVVASGT